MEVDARDKINHTKSRQDADLKMNNLKLINGEGSKKGDGKQGDSEITLGMRTNNLIGRAKREITELEDGENEIDYIRNDGFDDDQTGGIEALDSETRPGLKRTVDMGANATGIARANHRETENDDYEWQERENELRNGDFNDVDGGNRDNRATRNEQRQPERLQGGKSNKKSKEGTNRGIANEIGEVLDNEKSYEAIANTVIHDQRSEDLQNQKKTPVKYDHTDTNAGEITEEIKDTTSTSKGLVKIGLINKAENGSENNRANKLSRREQNEVDNFLKACEEGMEDKHKCESLKFLLRSKQYFPIQNKKKDNKSNTTIIDVRQNGSNSNENSINENDNNEDDSNGDDSNEGGRNEEERNEDDRSRKDNNGEGSTENDSVDYQRNGGESNEKDNNVDDSNREERNEDDSNEGDNYGKENNTGDSGNLSTYIKACEEGKIDQKHCDSLKAFLHQDELSISNNMKSNMKSIATRDYKMIDEDRDKEDQDEDDNEVDNDEDDNNGELKFLKRCKEGIEDKDECESFISFLKSQKESPIDKRGEDDIIDNKNKEDSNDNNSDERGGDEVSRYLKECEEGEEDQENCKSFKSFLKSQQELRIRKDSINDDGNDEDNNNEESKEINNKEGNSDEILTYLKDCEEGKEDRQDCESFKSFLKSHKQFAIYVNTKGEIANTTIRDIGMNGEADNGEHNGEEDSREKDNDGEDSNEVSKFLKRCEEGTEDNKECESLKSFLKSQDELRIENFKKDNMTSVIVRGNDRNQKYSKEGGSKKKKNNEADSNEEDGDEEYHKEILIFLKRCDEGKEDQEDCESMKDLLKSREEFFVDNNNEDNTASVIRSKNGANSDEENNDEVNNNEVNNNEVNNNEVNNNEKGEDVEDRNKDYTKEIFFILNECKEGKEDKNYCESLKSLLKSQLEFTSDKEMKNNTISLVTANSKINEEDDKKNSNKENDNEEYRKESENNEGDNNRKNSNEEAYAKMSISGKICEEGTGNKKDCDLLRSIHKSSKKFPINYELSSIKTRNTNKNESENNKKDSNKERRGKETNDKMSIILKNCEEGKGNQKNCKFFQSLQKSEKQFSIDNNKKDDKTYKVTNDVNKNEEDSKINSSVFKVCENGKEDEAVCAILKKMVFSKPRTEHVKNMNEKEHKFFKQSNEVDGKRRSNEQTRTFNFEKDCKGGKEYYDICKLYLDLVNSREKQKNTITQQPENGIEDRNDTVITDNSESQEGIIKETRDGGYHSAVGKTEYLKKEKSEMNNKRDDYTRDTIDSKRQKAKIMQHLQETSYIKKILRNLRRNVYQLRKLLDIDASERGKEEFLDYGYEYGSREEDKMPNREKRQTYVLEAKRSEDTTKNESGLDKGGKANAKELAVGKKTISRKMSEFYRQMDDRLFGGSKLKPGKLTKTEKETEHFN